MAREFVLVRIGRMRDTDLDLFEFDYDLTWMGFFVTADGRVLGRYGGRDATSPDSRSSLAGLRHAMTRALELHRAGKAPPAPVRRSRPRTVMDYPAAKRLPPKACVHCHQVYDLRRESLQAAGKWTLDELWVYPLPENVGIELEVDRGDTVAAVLAGSPAARIGLRKGDRLLTAGGRPVASFADVQHALHRAPASGTLAVTWTRGRDEHGGELKLAPGWRKTDVSWRWSLRGLDPQPWVHGEDLTPEQKKALGLRPAQLALEQGPFVSQPARQAGIQQGDVIIGADGKMLELTAQQFAAHVRLNYKVGGRIRYLLLRNGRRVEVTLTLRAR